MAGVMCLTCRNAGADSLLLVELENRKPAVVGFGATGRDCGAVSDQEVAAATGLSLGDLREASEPETGTER